jgi:hypothetical protein
MVGRGGTVDASQRGYGELGAVEQVELGFAVADEGGFGRGLAGVCRAYGKLVKIT